MNLSIIFKRIINETITVELKNGIILHGTLLDSDKLMNIYLKKVKKTNNSALNLNLESISIRGNTIRYVILPIWINFDSILYLKNKSKEQKNF
nr:small nuclear ribonucleoprotein D1 [Cryptomonas curvata]|mmetsp:Transcript_3369/g.7428  ORF Transcript_3369/g.7428 Transcript_3369/m.7428 type:complete len:93 (-) Transcript_3369:3131-3409(-)